MIIQRYFFFHKEPPGSGAFAGPTFFQWVYFRWPRPRNDTCIKSAAPNAPHQGDRKISHNAKDHHEQADRRVTDPTAVHVMCVVGAVDSGQRWRAHVVVDEAQATVQSEHRRCPGHEAQRASDASRRELSSGGGAPAFGREWHRLLRCHPEWPGMRPDSRVLAFDTLLY